MHRTRECGQLDKEAFEVILQSRTSIAEDISTILALRRYALNAVQSGIEREQLSQVQQSTEIPIRIRFFGLE